MRLQRLEIAGFKIFPDRSELAFDHGVTAIVGPNGCGKSNVVDAITWVLGEQSAKSLRGDRMEDVIFSGSDARKPTGDRRSAAAAGGVPRRRRPASPDAVAQRRSTATATPIAARRSNDCHRPRRTEPGHRAMTMARRRSTVERTMTPPPIVRDVEVMRRLYRSGESEYLIDGEICRLRDVHDLLMDAGLGVKAYAIIEQGKIGQILSARPTDRRQLIEEAAGVTKYKSRRRAGGAEARGGAAEPHARRRHRLRGREAARHAEAAGGEGAPLQAAARRAAPLGEGAVRARATARSASAIESARAKLADARERETAAAARLAEVEATLERLRHRAGRGGQPGDRARARRRTRANSRSAGCSSSSPSTGSRSSR